MSGDPIDAHVGARVKMRRKLIGMSQEKLGEALGVTFQQVQKYEKGTNRIGGSNLHKISQALNVPVSFFFEGLSEIAEPASDEMRDLLANVLTADGLRLTKAFFSIRRERTRRRVLDLLTEIAAEPVS